MEGVVDVHAVVREVRAEGRLEVEPRHALARQSVLRHVGLVELLQPQPARLVPLERPHGRKGRWRLGRDELLVEATGGIHRPIHLHRVHPQIDHRPCARESTARESRCAVPPASVGTTRWARSLLPGAAVSDANVHAMETPQGSIPRDSRTRDPQTHPLRRLAPRAHVGVIGPAVRGPHDAKSTDEDAGMVRAAAASPAG